MLPNRLKIKRLKKLLKRMTGWSLLSKVIALLLVIIFLFTPQQVVFAKTENAGSEFELCTGQVTQPAYTTESYPEPTFHWSFDSSQSDWTDGSPPPNDPTPVLGPSTQSSFWIEVDNNSDFSSPEIATGETASSNEYYAYTGSSLSFDTQYYWRLKVKDSYASISDWAEGDFFTTNKPSVRLKGGIRLKGGTKLK